MSGSSPYALIIIFAPLTSLLSCRFWERKLHFDAIVRAKNQAQRSRTFEAGSAL